MTDKVFDPYAWTLKDVVDTNFYEVPIYQRPYTWSTSEVTCLLDDLFSAYGDMQENDVYFTGQLFLRKKSKGSDGVKDKYEVVDGQQRLTTFSMMLISILSIAKKRGFNDNEKEISDLRSFLWKYSRTTREYNKKERLITLSSIDKDVFEFIFDEAFGNAKGIINTILHYTIKCETERNLIEMFRKVYDRIEKEIPDDPEDKDAILRFLAFLLEKTLFITIQSSIDMPHVFSVFESINSKGKPLDDIDKIKTFIFSVLDESDYATYLTRWGQLILKTDDKLEEYLLVYIRAYLYYYRVKINLKEFKWIARQLPGRYGVSTQAEALKMLIDNMLEKADAFSTLRNESIFSEVNKAEFTTFYRLFECMEYSHPKPLFFRAYCEYKLDDHRLSKEELTLIVKSATLFMFKFQSIRGGDSKDAIKYFQKIAEAHYDKDKLDAQFIKNAFSDALVKEGVDLPVIRSSFISMDFYSKRNLAYCVLSLLESVDESNGNKLLYSQASMMLSHMKDQTFHVDHMLPQNPDKDDKKLKYYCDNSSGENLLVLKSGHDFPSESVVDGMKYAEFESRTLHRIGNIRLYLPQLNIEKGNEVTHLPDHEDFTTYSQIISRCEKLANILLEAPDLN